MHACARACSVFVVLYLVSIILPSAVCSESGRGILKLTILYMNDPHAHYVPYEKKGVHGRIGGFGKALSVIKAAEARCASEGRRTLLLMAGDLVMGTQYSTVFKGALGVTLMNYMHFDAMAVGNHEFDYGRNNLLKQLKPLMEFPLLSENIRTREGTYVFDRVIMKKYPGSGTRVIIFGLTTSDTPVTTLPANVQGLQFKDPIETARHMLTDFNREDFIIALTHLGIYEDRKLAEACPKIDVIIGGHSHTRIFNPEKIGETLICQAGAYSEFLGRLDVDVADGKILRHTGYLILLGPAVLEDAQIASIIKSHEARMNVKLNEIIGKTEVFLDGARKHVREGTNTNLGRLITSIMARTCMADAAIINGGSVRQSLNKGPITLGEVYSVLPFRGTLVKLNLSGADLQAVLQRSHDLREGSGGKLQVFGVTWGIHHGRVHVERVSGRNFDPAGIYSVAINNFLLAGGDGYKIFKEKGRNVEKVGSLIVDLLVDYIRENKVLTKDLLEKG